MEKRKLLAAIAVLALAMCAFVAFVPASETDAVAATNVPAVGDDGKITVGEELELNGDATITNGLVLKAALTIPETATLTINYAFQASKTGTNESVITFESGGKLIVEGKVIINASNESGYTPGEKATNHILFKEGGYSSAADIQVKSGSLEMNMDKAVKGALNNGKFYLDVDGGNVKFNGNSVTTMYIVQDGGSIEFVQNDGSVMAYIDMNGGSMTVSGTNTTGAAADNPYIFVPYAMDIASSATLNVNGAMSIYTKEGGGTIDSTLPSEHGLTISTVTNAGKINVNASGSIDVPTGATMELGTINSSGNVDVAVDKAGIEDALENPAVDSIVYTGATAPEVTKLNKSLTIENSAAIPSEASIVEGGSISVASATEGQKLTISTTIKFKDGDKDVGSIALSNVTADSVEFYYGSAGVYIEGVSGTHDITITGDGKIKGSLDGDAQVTLKGNGTVVVDGKLTLGNEAELTIDSGVTFKAGSGLVGPTGKDATATIVVKGTFEYNTLPANVKIDNQGGIVKVEGGQGTENIISVSQSVNGTYYLTADTTILSGVTLTVPRNATLDLMGYELTVKGTLVVENRGLVTSSVQRTGDNGPTYGSIVLATTGSIQNEGTIGDTMEIDIVNGEKKDQIVSVKGVNGVNIELIRSIEGTGNNAKRVYDMAVSGEIGVVRGVDAPSITLTNVDINKSMTIADDITVTIAGTTDVLGNGTVFTLGDAVMNIDGGTFTLYDNGTSAVLNGHVVGKIDVNVGKVSNTDGKLYPDAAEPAASVTFTDSNTTNNVGSYMVGMTISAKRVTVPVEDGDAQIYQRMFVNGELKAVNDDKEVSEPAGTIAFGGNVYIAETLAIPEDTTVNAVQSGTYTLMVSEGGVVSAVENQDLSYNGVRYEIDGEKTTDPSTFYYTDFATAMEALATTADETIYLDGKFTITGTYTVGADLAIESLDNVLTKVTVGEGSVITVDAEGYISPVAFMKIEGKVTALEGEGYLPSDADNIYAVKAVDEETLDTTYSGFKTAMDEATAGQTIEVVGDAMYDGDLVIPNGVTVNVNETVELTVTGDVTVENGGKLVLEASKLIVGEKDSENVVTVAGELDASDAGQIVAYNDAVKGEAATSVDIYSTGKIVSTTVVGGDKVTMNSAYYYDGEYVYTSLANAVAYAEENALPTGVNVTGTFTETGAVESDGVIIVVDNDANVTLGDLTLNNAKISSAAAANGAKQGTYTATITALNGAGDAAVNATVAVSKTTATVESKVTLNAEGTSQYALQIDNLAGANVQAGTVTYVGDDITVSTKDNGFTVSSGATLLVKGDNSVGLTVNAGMAIVNNGTIEVAKDATLTIEGTVAGDISVPKDATLVVAASKSATITGTVTVAADGKFNVNGNLQVGAAPELLTDVATGAVVGKVNLAYEDNQYILAFAGADLSQADIVNTSVTDLKSTAYQINGVDFATIYTFGSIYIDGNEGTIVYDAVDSLKDLYMPATGTGATATPYDIVWYAGETKINSTDTVGEYAQVSTEIRYNTVDIVVSAGPAITVSIDGVVWDGWNPTSLTIGTHTVSAVVNPGYTGTIQITFNGQAVTNGQIEITSDMLNSIEDIVLSASGNITQDSTVVVDGGSSGDSGMGLTDYLLIILVILIVVMAIMVAMRLMRS